MPGDPLRITVAMVTCDGARHVGEQVGSILAQSRPADAVLVGDDASLDGTDDILSRASRSARSPMTVLSSTERLGLTANLERVLRAVPPGVVVLSDQDDVWHPAKIATLERAFADPAVVLWFSDADLVDESGRPLGRTAWDAVRFTASDRQAVAAGRGVGRLLHGMTVTGATMAFRTELLDWALPFPPGLDEAVLFRHDGWLAVLGALRGAVVPEPSALVSYRQHPAQLTGEAMSREPGPGPGDADRAERLWRDAARARLVADRVRAVADPAHRRRPQVRELLDLDAFLGVRTGWTVRGSRRLRVVRAAIRGDYARHGRGLRTVAADLAEPLVVGGPPADLPEQR